MRKAIVLLLLVNIGLGLFVVYRQQNYRKIRMSYDEEQKISVHLQREHEQLRGEKHSAKGNLEDEMIARNRLNMHSPTKESQVVTIPAFQDTP